MKFIFLRKTIIKKIAKEVAEYQRKADYFYYIKEDKDMSSHCLDNVIPLIYLSNKLNITDEVYKEAYKVYDFRNSGTKGFKPNLDEIKAEKCQWGRGLSGNKNMY